MQHEIELAVSEFSSVILKPNAAYTNRALIEIDIQSEEYNTTTSRHMRASKMFCSVRGEIDDLRGLFRSCEQDQGPGTKTYCLSSGIVRLEELQTDFTIRARGYSSKVT